MNISKELLDGKTLFEDFNNALFFVVVVRLQNCQNSNEKCEEKKHNNLMRG
jgi:hypothetical protein